MRLTSSTGSWRGCLLGAVLTSLLARPFVCQPQSVATNLWSLSSPDGQCQIGVSLDHTGAASYEVWRDGRLVVAQSPLGLQCDDQGFGAGLVFDRATKSQLRRETYELFAGGASQVNHLLNGRTLVFRNTNNALIEIDLAASNEGVAFRYRFADTNNRVRVVQAELTGFAVPVRARGWLQPYHTAGPYTPAYEDFYFDVSPRDAPPDSRARAVGWAFPALFHIEDAGAWMLLTESGTDGSYCACHLGPDSTNGTYHIVFPLPDEGTKGYDNRYSPNPRFTTPWTMPWRVIVLGQSACSIASATLVTDLAPASRVADTSWIHPSRASWGWWSYPEGPATAGMFNQFTDFAARMGWEYTLFDAGWGNAGLTNIVSHTEAKGIKSMVWLHASDVYDAPRRKRRLDELVAAGVGGVKVDFWCSDRQEAIAAMVDLFADAAERKLAVNLHGCTVPRGWERTWPNFLTCEAVLGTESYFYEPRYTEKAAELNTVLPFTRNAIGPMDSTPVACSPKKFARMTTAAHELATAITLKSGLIHYADKPEFFETLPKEALRILRDAPARWDETRCLLGEPGRLAVFARRSCNSWFIAGLNGTAEPIPVSLDLSMFVGFTQRLAITEGHNPAMQVAVVPLTNATPWQHSLLPRGGFILRLDKPEATETK